MSEANPLVIAHRGASGYLPEHTLEAKVFAYAQGADFVEQDLVATRDDEVVVLHDIHLDRVTDVARKYPGRARDDGRYYARDFTVAEIRQLFVNERQREDGTPVYPGRYPAIPGRMRVPTFAEELRLVAGLNASTGRNVGVYPEIKRPAWHRSEGVDLSGLVIAQLADAGYTEAADAAFLQCFDATETRRLREELGTRLRVVQLLGENTWGESATDYEVLKTPAGLADISTYADAVGPWIGHIVKLAEIDGQPVSTGFVSAAHAAGLLVHPYTFRAEELVPGFESLPEMVRWFVEELDIDGLFCDFPDQALAGLGRAMPAAGRE